MLDALPGECTGGAVIEREEQLEVAHDDSVTNRCSLRQIRAAAAAARARYAVAMPVYEYFCQDCRSVFELLRPMAERQLTAVCPMCESRSSTPLVSRVALRAGSGAADFASPSGGGCACPGACSCAN